MNGFKSLRLSIHFEPADGPDNLTIIDAGGNLCRSPIEQPGAHQRLTMEANLRAEQQLLQAETKYERALQEFKRAEQQEHRADRLAVKLHELGVEPD